MFVFAEEYAVVYVSFDPSNEPAEFTEVSDLVNSADVLKEILGRTGGNRDRIEEYYKTIVKPFI